MTANELRNKLNDTYGLDNKWPEKLEVDHETYANCCQAIFDYLAKGNNNKFIDVAIGKYNGILFKNVELILKK